METKFTWRVSKTKYEATVNTAVQTTHLCLLLFSRVYESNFSEQASAYKP